jgi:uncharacterized membrane protein YsdA (DUF1294 family)
MTMLIRAIVSRILFGFPFSFRFDSSNAGPTLILTIKREHCGSIDKLDRMTIAAIAYLCLVVVMSIVAFFFYGFDKQRAKIGGRRVPEQTLHILAFLGGWPGALLAQRILRHKTQKISFRIAFWIVVILHLSTIGAVAYAMSGSSGLNVRSGGY